MTVGPARKDSGTRGAGLDLSLTPTVTDCIVLLRLSTPLLHLSRGGWTMSQLEHHSIGLHILISVPLGCSILLSGSPGSPSLTHHAYRDLKLACAGRRAQAPSVGGISHNALLYDGIECINCQTAPIDNSGHAGPSRDSHSSSTLVLSILLASRARTARHIFMGVSGPGKL